MLKSILSKMNAEYTRPSVADQARLVNALRYGEEQGSLLLRLESIEPRHRVPWEPATHVMDAHVVLGTSFSEQLFHAPKESHGSGCSEDTLAAAAHAISESLERALVVAGGERGLRAHPNDVWSEFRGRWVRLPYDPLLPAQGANKNPDFSRSGEAFHINEGEALRAAYCEVLERDALNRSLSKPEMCRDITDAAAELFSIAAIVRSFWAANSYQFRLLLLPSTFNILTVMAIAKSSDPHSFRSVFKGVAADFRLTRAVEQAISELGRNAFTGPAVECLSEEDLRRQLLDDEVSEVVKPN